MKKMFLIASAALVLASCNKEASGYTITGTVAGFDDGTKVYISQPDENAQMGLTRIDSAEIKGGKFEMKGQAKDIELKFIEIGKTQEFAVPFIYENGKIVFDYNKEKPEEAKVSGSQNNDYLTTYNKEAFVIQKKMRDFQTNNMARIQQAQQDPSIMEALRADYEKLQNEMKDQSLNFIKTKKDAFISLILLEQLVQSQAITTAQFKEYFNALDVKVKDSKKGKELDEMLKKLSAVEVGNPAPDFKAPDPQGKMVSLKESLGKITVLDFWASWCGPCRQENPEFVRIYNQYKDKGLAFFGVSLDKDADRWIKAIEDDKLTWTHVSNLKQWQDPIAKQYGITAIPATFILDEKGVIIARDLRGPELEAKIAELLK